MNLEFLVVIILLFAMIVILLKFMAIKEKQHQEERKDLQDRIMSKDIVEYKEQTAAPVKYGPVDLDEEEEYNREIEQQKSGYT